MVSPVKVWRNQKNITRMVGKRGAILAYTMVRTPPSDFSYLAPYPVAVVRLADGKRITAQVVDYSDAHLTIGQAVMTVVRRTAQSLTDDVIPYGIKVKPI